MVSSVPCWLPLLVLVPLCSSETVWRHRGDFEKVLKEGCPPPVAPSPDLPTVPESFISRVEVALQSSGKEKVINGLEMFDGVTNRGLLDYQIAEGISEARPFLVAEQIHYDVPRDEALFVLSDVACDVAGTQECDTSKLCQAGKIENLAYEIQQLFGIVQVPGEHGFFGASGILEFGAMFNYTKVMEMSCRGARCDLFQTCLEKPEENATVLYTYAWSNNDWSNEGGAASVPVYVEVFSTGKFEGHTTKKVEMRYDFFDFQRDIRPSYYALEPPPDVYCINRNSRFPPPPLPAFFSYSAELVTGVNFDVPDGQGQNYTVQYRAAVNTDEYYDSGTNISRVDHLGLKKDQAQRFEEKEMTIHDFNMGLTFHVYPTLGSCNISTIENSSSVGAILVLEDGTVTMARPDQLMQMRLPYQYNGRHWTRNMETEVWAGVTESKVDPAVNETYVWYYASPWTTIISGYDEADEQSYIQRFIVPLKLERYNALREDLPHLIKNLYGFESAVPHSHRHDASTCFPPAQTQHYRVSLPSDALNTTQGMRESLLYGLNRALAGAGGVSPLRVNRPQLVESPHSVDVVFTMLGKPEIEGNSHSASNEVDLSTAVSAIRAAVNAGDLVATVTVSNWNSTTTVSVTVKPGSMVAVSRDSGRVEGQEILVGYSPGSMTGLGIGMTVIGAGLAVVGIAFYEKRKMQL